MPSLVGHVMSVSGIFVLKKDISIISKKLIFFVVLCTILPDIDMIGYKIGVPYDSFFGHRGFTHSLLFAFLIALSITIIFFKKETKKSITIFTIFFFSMVLHDLLDMLTTGGLGIMLFTPFYNERLFFPIRFIEVSAINGNILIYWFKNVLLNEIIFLLLPSLIIASIYKKIN